MKRASFATVALVALLFTPPTAQAAKKSCLIGTDPSVATDPMQITAVRESIASTCLCSSFDGSKGHAHIDYVKCAKGVIANAVTAGQLRKQCTGTLATYYAVSTCGLPPNPAAAPCITRSTSGSEKCAIKPTGKCRGTACAGFTVCIDAADTNDDGLINQNDSGLCNPVGGGTQFTASLNGMQAGTMSTATGSCSATLNGTQTSLSIRCTHNVMNPTAAHVHDGAPGVAGPIVFPFNDPTSPINARWSTIMANDVANLMAGNLYVNIHSNNCQICPAGEIRGQLLPVP